MMLRSSYAQVGLLVLFLSSLGAAQPPRVSSKAVSSKGMVVSVCPHASQVGADVLAAGGNAVDAAIAVEFALAVTWPEAGNIGGGGFMMVHPARGDQVLCIDYREVAPLKATERMFQPRDGRYTHKIVGVPGTVRGMELAHKRFGSRPWKTLVEPAIRLARDGFQVDEALAGSLNGVLRSSTASKTSHRAELVRVYGTENGRSWKSGDTIKLPDLAKTLQRIADGGADGFYLGETARLLAEEMNRGDGLIDEKDLKEYRAKVRPAIRGTFRGHDVYGPPPPSSGGVCIVQMLNVLERLDLRAHSRYSSRNIHVMAEAMRRAFCDRARHLGDGDFVAIPQRLTGKKYAEDLLKSIKPDRATKSTELAPEIRVSTESPSTTHFSVVDRDGMAVSNTTTLEGSWGARIVVRNAGFVLNNEMGDFNWFPGHTDTRGRIGTRANRIQPGKRMLSSQSPTIVAQDGLPVLVTGSPGGRTIINTSLQMVLNVVEFKMTLEDAMNAPRIHHQWLPDRLQIESFNEDLVASVPQLKKIGHTVELRSKQRFQGDAHSILIDRSKSKPVFVGVADWRRNGAAVGAK